MLCGFCDTGKRSVLFTISITTRVMDIDILFGLEICFMIYLSESTCFFFAGLNQPKKGRRLHVNCDTEDSVRSSSTERE